MSFRISRAKGIGLVILAGMIAVALVFVLSGPKSLAVVSSGANLEVSAERTVGRTHVYSYARGMVHPVEVALVRLRADRDAYRLRYESDREEMVVWVRVMQEGHLTAASAAAGDVRMPEGGYSRLQARLVSGAGQETFLRFQPNLQRWHSTKNGGCYVQGWILPGSIDQHHGSELRLESPEGGPIATLVVR